MELTINNISKSYGRVMALDGVTCSMNEGIYGLLGPNGAGKTTLINLIINAINSDRGQILYNGRDIKKLGNNYLDIIGYLPQYPIFYKNYSIYEFLEYICCLKNITRKESKSRISDVLKCVNLRDVVHRKIGALSGGMRQRLGIAQAIINDPKILILDEPTAGLDPLERIRFRKLISQIAKNKIVLMATHIVSDIEYTAKEIILIHEGKLMVKGNVSTICEPLKGRLWNIEVDETMLEEVENNYNVISVRRSGMKYETRIYSNSEPQYSANPVEPTLEDLLVSVVGNTYAI